MMCEPLSRPSASSCPSPYHRADSDLRRSYPTRAAPDFAARAPRCGGERGRGRPFVPRRSRRWHAAGRRRR